MSWTLTRRAAFSVPEYLAPGLHGVCKRPLRAINTTATPFPKSQSASQSLREPGGSKRLMTGQPPETPNDTITKLRIALSAGNVRTVHEKLLSLEESASLHLLPTRDIEHIAESVMRALKDSKAAIPNPAIRYLSLFIATSPKRDTRALASCMRRALHSGELDTVSTLWNDLYDRLLSPELLEAEASPRIPGLTNPPVAAVTQFDDILACVMIANAMKRDFRAALEASLRRPMFSATYARWVEYASGLPNRSKLIGELEKYRDAIRIARAIVTPAALAHRFHNFFAQRDVDTALDEYKRILKGVRASPPWISPIEGGHLQEGGTCVASLTRLFWSTVIGGFLQCDRPELAEDVWKDMERLKVEHDVFAWNALLSGIAKRGNFPEAEAVWKSMDNAGVKKDVASYTSMISALFQWKMADKALELFDELRQKSFEGTVAPSGSDPVGSPSSNGNTLAAFTYNAVIHGLLISGRPEQAQSLMEDMKAHGPPPDTITYNTFLRHFSRKYDKAGFAATLSALGASGLKPDVVTLTATLDALQRFGQSKPIEALEVIMTGMNVVPNEVTYTSIIESRVRSKGQANFDAAFEILDRMTGRGLKPNEITYTGLLAGLQRDRSLDPAYAKAKTDKIIKLMRAKKGALPNRVTYNVLIHACLAKEGMEGLTQAMDKYREMIASGTRATDDTWYILLSGALSRRATGVATQLVREMWESGFEPRGSLAILVERARRGEAIGLYGRPPTR